MSALDTPIALVLIGVGGGSIVGVIAFYAVCALVEWIRR